MKPGDLVLYSAEGNRIPLDVYPGMTEEDADGTPPGPSWPHDEVGLVLEVSQGQETKGNTWVRVLISTGTGWCLQPELQVIINK